MQIKSLLILHKTFLWGSLYIAWVTFVVLLWILCSISHFSWSMKMRSGQSITVAVINSKSLSFFSFMFHYYTSMCCIGQFFPQHCIKCLWLGNYLQRPLCPSVQYHFSRKCSSFCASFSIKGDVVLSQMALRSVSAHIIANLQAKYSWQKKGKRFVWWNHAWNHSWNNSGWQLLQF